MKSVISIFISAQLGLIPSVCLATDFKDPEKQSQALQGLIERNENPESIEETKAEAIETNEEHVQVVEKQILTKHLVIKSGTPIVLKLLTPISSKDSKEGEALSFTVVNTITDPETGKPLINSGASATGTITRVEKNGMAGKKGELGIAINSTQAADGTMVPLTASMQSEGKGARGTAIGLSVASLVVFWPLAFFIFKHGKDAKIPAGTQINAYVASDVALTPVQETVEIAKTTNSSEIESKVNYAQELELLQSLLQKGVITQSDFNAKKKQILGI